MRTMLRTLALMVSVVALAACGGSDSESGEAVPVEEFNRQAAASDAPWTRSPRPFVSRFLRLDQRSGEGLRISFEERDADDQPEIVVVLDRLADDSVRAERYVLSLERQDDSRLRLVSARRSWRCWEGRGHQDFSTELCL
jgi:hypothetical protein